MKDMFLLFDKVWQAFQTDALKDKFSLSCISSHFGVDREDRDDMDDLEDMTDMEDSEDMKNRKDKTDMEDREGYLCCHRRGRQSSPRRGACLQ